MLNEVEGRVQGRADERLAETVARFEAAVAGDPEYSFQAVAYRDGECVLDVWGGPYLGADTLIVPFSVSKNTIGLSVALLLQRGQIDLDERVATYWPEFAAKGKARVTVRQLLSHQAGLPQASPRLTWDELLDDHAAAARLADSWPYWYPGSAFGYHAIAIGNLASELVFRITGSTLQEFYERELRAPLGVDFHLGLPPERDGDRTDVLTMVPPVSGADHGPLPLILADMIAPGPAVDLGNDEASWRFGHPAGSGTASARGIARLLAATVTGLEGADPVLDAETVYAVGQQQVRGHDQVLGQADRAHAIVFQKPTPSLPLGGPRAFGHDGAMGCLGGVDPDTGVAYGYTVARGPWPGGADPRALAMATDLRRVFTA
jgi:CubicO group peptidase (beta-lactamase class C family)